MTTGEVVGATGGGVEGVEILGVETAALLLADVLLLLPEERWLVAHRCNRLRILDPTRFGDAASVNTRSSWFAGADGEGGGEWVLLFGPSTNTDENEPGTDSESSTDARRDDNMKQDSS